VRTRAEFLELIHRGDRGGREQVVRRGAPALLGDE
jgi:hypothetical protein